MVYAKFGNLSTALRVGANMDLQTLAVTVAAICLAVLPLEITHLLSMFVGAVGYLMLQAIPKMSRRQPSPKVVPGGTMRESSTLGKAGQSQAAPWRREARVPCSSNSVAAHSGPWEHVRAAMGAKDAPSGAAAAAAVKGAQKTALAAPGTCQAGQPTPRVEVRKPSAMPVRAPVFNAAGWEAEVQELLSRISPSPDGDAAVANIARAVQRIIRPCLPGAEVMGFASGNPLSGTAFGVAVPEVDIVISISPAASQDRWAQGRAAGGHAKLDARKLQKSTIRACTDRLVASGAFKFRRSAFRGQEPKVTLVALLSAAKREPGFQVGGASSPQAQQPSGIPISISVNAVTPLHCAALLTECGQIDPRAKSLILLVRRWAKDRGLSHAAKGHLSPYCWTLLAIFYLQVGLEAEEGAPLLPALDGFEASAALAAGRAAKGALLFPKSVAKPKSPKSPTARGSCEKQVGELFVGFTRFYAKCFDWRNEAVSVRLGSRGPPEVSLPLHIVLHDDGSTTEVGPSIEDPFHIGCNLGTCTNAASLARLRDELARAHDFCSRHASLSELLEPWAPPEAEVAARGEAQEDDEEDKCW